MVEGVLDSTMVLGIAPKSNEKDECDFGLKFLPVSFAIRI